jgi:hypothetical protein
MLCRALTQAGNIFGGASAAGSDATKSEAAAVFPCRSPATPAKRDYLERALLAMQAAIQKWAVAHAKSPTEISNVVLRLSPLARTQAFIAGLLEHASAAKPRV